MDSIENLPILDFGPDATANAAQILARRSTVQVVQALVDIALDPKQDANCRIKAGNSLLDRGWGKPDVHGTIDQTVKLVIDAPWMASNRLSYQRREIVDVAPTPSQLEHDPPPEEWRTDEQRQHEGKVVIPKDDEAKRLLNGPKKD